jgi:glycosyltransferase involved in cell wall biosynthesis
VRALVLSNMLADAGHPERGSFVRDQVAALRELEQWDVELYEFPPGVRALARSARDLHSRYTGKRFEVVHAHFGLTAWPALAVRAHGRALTVHGTDVRHPRTRLATRAALPTVGLLAAVSESLVKEMPGRRARERAQVLPCGVDMTRFKAMPRARAWEGLNLDPPRLLELDGPGGHPTDRPNLDAPPTRAWGEPNPDPQHLHSRQHISADLDPQQHVSPDLDPQQPRSAEQRRPYLLFPADPSRPEKRYDRAQALAEAVGARLLTLGGVPPERVPLYVNAAHAVIVPSEREGFGLAVIEALACDVPVLATPVGIHEQALDGLAGTLCAPFELKRWRAALAPHMASENPRVAGRERAERFSARRMAERVASAWRSLVAEAG